METNKITEIILGESFKLHNELGPGLLESAYEACLNHKLNKLGIKVEKQKQIPLIYKGVQLECCFRADLIVEEQVIIEVKSVEELTELHFTQLLTYLRLTELQVGLLINFNVKALKLGIRRVVNNYKREE